MLCCLNAPWKSPQDAYHSQTSDGLSVYPGGRNRNGFIPTGGNALAACPPSHQGRVDSGENLVSVTVPHGVPPGQSIRVAAPDGSGRMVSAVVPQGMSAGSKFMVKFPPAANTAAPAVIPEPPQTSSPDNAYAGVTVMAPPSNQYHGVSVMAPPATSSEPPYAVATPIPATAASSTPFAEVLGPAPGGAAASYPAPATISPVTASPVRPVPPPTTPSITSGQKMMKVQVPPGVAPGSTIHVKVPDEDRMIAAQVPPGVREFHVAYEPTRSSNVGPSSVPAAIEVEKLLLVRVPPGTGAGTTIHVQVPGEPGRLLAAKVPPGNVREFHVSYTPRSSQTGTPTRPQNSYSNNRQSNQGSGMGNMMMPLLGGAAMGAATMAMFDHHRYSNNGGGYADESAGYGDGGDFGGGDFGGGGDF